MEPRKEAILDALTKFMNQRSGIEFGNYGDVKAFRAEQRSIYTDLKHARVLLAAVKWRDGIDADALIKAASGAYSGRLTITMGCGPMGSGQWQCDIGYTAGQYFPTEYRRAVCAVLAYALRDYTRDKAMPAPTRHRVRLYNADGEYSTTGKLLQLHAAVAALNAAGGHSKGYIQDFYGPATGGPWVSASDRLRAYFRKEFGRTIASRWFS